MECAPNDIYVINRSKRTCYVNGGSTGCTIIVDGDDDAVIPFEDGYTCTLSDQGEHTFAKGFTFTTAGDITIYVYEIDTGLESEHIITITE